MRPQRSSRSDCELGTFGSTADLFRISAPTPLLNMVQIHPYMQAGSMPVNWQAETIPYQAQQDLYWLTRLSKAQGSFGL